MENTIEEVVTKPETHVESGNSPPSGTSTKPAAQKFRLFTINDLRTLPPPQWLIEDIIGLNTFGVLYGQPGEAKSFVALDMALSVATGHIWHSHPVKRRGVVYVVAEGGRAIAPRVEAWLKRAAISDVDGAFFLLEAPQVHKSADLNKLLKVVEGVGELGLVVIDTLARAFVGGEENSAKELGEWIDNARKVQVATGATVLVVHHGGKPGDGGPRLERGSSALRGAADTMVKVKLDKGTRIITLECDKQKDAEPFDTIKFKLDCFPVDETLTSCVPAPPDIASGQNAVTLNAGQTKTLKALLSLGGIAASTSWRSATGDPERTFHRNRHFLASNGYVQPVEGKKSWYQLTDAGTAAATSLPSTDNDIGPSDAAATATPLVGVACAAGVRNRWAYSITTGQPKESAT